MPVFSGIASGIGESIAAGDEKGDAREERLRNVAAKFGEGVRLNKHWTRADIVKFRDSLSEGGDPDFMAVLAGDEEIDAISAQNASDTKYAKWKRDDDQGSYIKKSLDAKYNEYFDQANFQPEYASLETMETDLEGIRNRWLQTRGMDIEKTDWAGKRPTDKTPAGLYAYIQGETAKRRRTKKTEAAAGWNTLRDSYLKDRTMTLDKYGGLQKQYQKGFGSILDDEFWGTQWRTNESIKQSIDRQAQIDDLEMRTAVATRTEADESLANRFNEKFNTHLSRSGDVQAALTAAYGDMGVDEDGEFKKSMDKRYLREDFPIDSRMDDLSMKAWDKWGKDLNDMMTQSDRVVTKEEIAARMGIPKESKIIEYMMKRANYDRAKNVDERRSTSIESIAEKMTAEKAMTFWMNSDVSDEARWAQFMQLADHAKYPGLAALKDSPDHDLMWDIINLAHQNDWTYGQANVKKLRASETTTQLDKFRKEFSGKDYADQAGDTLRGDFWPVKEDLELHKDSGYSKESFTQSARNSVLQLFLQGEKNYRFDPQTSPEFQSHAVNYILSHSKELSSPDQNPSTMVAWLRARSDEIFDTFARENNITSPLTQEEYVTRKAGDAVVAKIGPAYVTEEDYLDDTNARVEEAKNLAAVVKQNSDNRAVARGASMGVVDWGNSQMSADHHSAIKKIQESIAFLTEQAGYYQGGEGFPNRMKYGNVKDRTDLMQSVQILQTLLKEVMSADYNLDDSFEISADRGGTETTAAATSSNLEATLITPWVAMGLNEDDGAWQQIKAGRKGLAHAIQDSVDGKAINKPEGTMWKWKVKGQEHFENDERFGSMVAKPTFSRRGYLPNVETGTQDVWQWNEAGKALGFK